MHTVILTESLTIANIVKCRQVISDSLKHSKSELILNLSNVEDCDSSGVQLLISASRSAQEADRRLILTNYSESILKALKTVGVDNIEEFFSLKE